MASWRRCAALALGAGALGLGFGCDNAAAAASALEQAEGTLAAMHTSGLYLYDDAQRREVYAGTIATLRTAAEQGNEGQQAAAQALIGHALAGQAQIEASEATRLEQQAVHEASVARSRLNHMVIAMRAQAEAATSVASTSDQQRVEVEARTLEGERTQRTNELRAIQSEIDSLRQRVSAARAAADEHRRREAALRIELLDTEGASRADLSMRTVDAQRQADLREREAAELEAELAVLRPRAQLAETQISSLTSRIAMLGESRQRMRKRDDVVREQANSQLAAAEANVREIDAAITQLDTFRQTDLREAFEAAERTTGQAIDAMRRASTARVSSPEWCTATMITLGGLQQSLGDLHTARADGQERYAALLERLSDPALALPRASTYRQYLERVRNEVRERREAAASAFADARSSCQGAGARGDVAQRLEDVSRSLESRSPGQQQPGGASDIDDGL